VIEVTNLNDSGPGTLRAALEASGPRIVVFRVGGTIDLQSALDISNPFITIAGQTAPGGGILLKGNPVSIETNDVIIRHLRSRPGPNVANPGAASALGFFRGSSDIIVDHSSFSWGTDEVLEFWGNGSPGSVRDITVQHSIISEGLNCSVHPEGCHSMGILIGNGATNLTFYRNLLAHHGQRNPEIQTGTIELVNNIIYNPNVTVSLVTKGSTSSLRVKVDAIGNFYKEGVNAQNREMFYKGPSWSNPLSLYVQGNIGKFRTDDTQPEENVVPTKLRASIVTTPNINQSQTNPKDSAFTVFDKITSGDIGASLPIRDAVDVRIISETINRNGSIINSPSQVGGYPVYQSGTPLADTDRDGMPDNWETQNGFNPSDPSDGPQDSDGDGYTNVEEYLNSLIPGTGGSSPPSTPNPPTNIIVGG